MNKQRLLELADHVESLPPERYDQAVAVALPDDDHYAYAPVGKTMEQCGSRACIGGHAVALWDPGQPIMGCLGRAADLLDLDCEQAKKLFTSYPEGLPDSYRPTPAQAAATLRHLAATGVADWSAGG